MTDLKPCPLCGANMLPESDGYEHPADDTCPLDSLYIEARHVAAWNTRAAIEASVQKPNRTAALRAKLAEVERDRDQWRIDCEEFRLERDAAQTDRDEERKLADKAVALLSRVHMEYPAERHVRDQLVARHAARRKEQQG